MLYFFSSERPCFPFFFDSGAERTIYAIIEGLVDRGIKIVQICALPESGLSDEVLAFCRNLDFEQLEYLPSDRQNAFNIKSKEKWILLKRGKLSIIGLAKTDYYETTRYLISALKPDLLITYLKGGEPLIKMAHEMGVPTVHRVFGVGAYNFPPLSPSTRLLANSPIAALACRDRYGYLPDFIYSLVDFEKYKVQNAEPKYATFINPREKKGLYLFCKIVGLLPQIPFLAVQGWGGDYSPEEKQALAFLQSAPNVRLIPAVLDVRSVYAKTKILIAPSKWVETFGRVIVEAQINGVPVVASNRGNLPATIGEGGFILPYGDPQLWADTIRKLYVDEVLLQNMKSKAKDNSKRFDPALLMRRYHDFFLKAVLQETF